MGERDGEARNRGHGGALQPALSYLAGASSGFGSHNGGIWSELKAASRSGWMMCAVFTGMGERAIEAMVERGLQRTAFKRRIAEHGGFQQQLARARIRLDAARLTVLDAAHSLDLVGNKKV